MKHVRALAEEPPLLARYRAMFPAEDQRPANEATRAWNEFKTDQPAYKELLARLIQAQQGLCIYCEQSLVDNTGELVSNDYQVEHVKAKSGAVGRVLDWENLALACAGGSYPHHRDRTRVFTNAANTSCGQTKGDADLPRGCDPRTLPLVHAVVEVDTEGRLTVNAQHCAKAGVAPAAVNNAIALLQLDCERLRLARQGVADETRSWFVFMLEELCSSRLTLEQQQTAVELLVAGRLQPDGSGLPRFWTAVRCAIGADAESWLAANQGQFTGPSILG